MEDAPDTPWTPEGTMAFGTFRGECNAVPMSQHFGRLDRLRQQKRWQWFGVFSEEVALGAAIVRTGYASNVFCWVFDRQKRTFLHDVSRVLPRAAVDVAETPRHGRAASYQVFVEGLEINRNDSVWNVSGTIGDVMLDLELRESGTPMTAICPVKDNKRHLNVTRKQTQATAKGVIRSGTRRFDLSGATALLDHSHGMLARDTSWKWAIGSGTFEDSGEPVGFNLIGSFNESLENAVWIDGEPSTTGIAEFIVPDDLTGVWRVHNERLDLTMVPEGLRAQALDLGVIVSDYQQPLGEWTGTIDGRAVRALGVIELHRSVW